MVKKFLFSLWLASVIGPPAGLGSPARHQTNQADQTNHAEQGSESAQGDQSDFWGYSYDSLLKDLKVWKQHPNVKVDSVGATAKGRALWMVSITGIGDSLALGGNPQDRKHRVFIHARTHPSEVQANYVANEAIRFLLDSTEEVAQLRAGFIFNIIPMYNPDGVQEGRARENGNGINLETNWDVPQPEVEVLGLRKVFQSFMDGPIPIEVALNLHSDQFNASRFFWFHYAAGTSLRYAELEKQYIALVQGRFPGGIKNWDAFQSWPTEPRLIYPEGFWWSHYREDVMALTFEDINGPTASKFDSTGRALVMGSADYIRSRIPTRISARIKFSPQLKLESQGIRISNSNLGLNGSQTNWKVMDLQGRIQARGILNPGENFLTWNALAHSWGGILWVNAQSGMNLRLPLHAP